MKKGVTLKKLGEGIFIEDNPATSPTLTENQPALGKARALALHGKIPIMIYIIAYGIVALIFVRPLAGHLTYLDASEYYHPSPADWIFGFFFGILLAAIWPIPVMIHFITPFLKRINSIPHFKVGAEKKHYQKKAKAEENNEQDIKITYSPEQEQRLIRTIKGNVYQNPFQ